MAGCERIFQHEPVLWFAEEDIVDTATLRDPKPVGVLRVTASWQSLFGVEFRRDRD